MRTDMSAVSHIRSNVLKVTQAALAEIAGTTQATVSRWESGELHPNLAELLRIREEARRRGIEWRDEWFFEAPKPAPEQERIAS